jgi:hypothetical protein
MRHLSVSKCEVARELRRLHPRRSLAAGQAGRSSHVSAAFTHLPQLVSDQKPDLALVPHRILAQSAMVAFNDIYRLLAALTASDHSILRILRKSKTYERCIDPIEYATRRR